MISTFRFCIVRINHINTMKSSSSAQEARMLKKMIDRGLKREKSGFHVPKVLKKKNLLSAYTNEGITKRMSAFNKMYMEHIPEMIYCGNFGSYVNEMGIKISKVQISKDFNFLNVYYVSSKADIPEHKKNEFLNKAVEDLQKSMGNLKFSGKVPYVRLINDVRLENEMKLESIFDTFDMGKDLPIPSKKVHTPNTVSKQTNLPVMRQDVLGINVEKIKARISADIFRVKSTEDVKSNKFTEEPEVPQKLIQFSNKEFFKFYKRRRIEELKMRKKERQAMHVNESMDASYMNENEDEFEKNYEIEYSDEYFDESAYEYYECEDECEDEDEDEDEHEA